MHKTEVYILGQKYTIKGERTPEEIQKLAAYVDEKLRKVYEQNSAIPPLRAAILTCFYIADELYETKKECEITKHELKNLKKKQTNYFCFLINEYPFFYQWRIFYLSVFSPLISLWRQPQPSH